MVALRLIPCLDVANGRVVKGVNFVGLRDAGDPVELASRYSKAGAAKEGLTKCMEKFTNFSDQENNACYVHYESVVGNF